VCVERTSGASTRFAEIEHLPLAALEKWVLTEARSGGE
jgi:hypothetical protein